MVDLAHDRRWRSLASGSEPFRRAGLPFRPIRVAHSRQRSPRNQETIFFMKTSQDDNDIMALWTESTTLINSLKLSFNLIWLKSNYLKASDDLKTETEESLDHLIKELEQEKRIVESLKNHVSKTKTSPKR